MASPRSVTDPAFEQVRSAKDKAFYPSPDAWEDQVFYFLLPDRFSNNKEASARLYTAADIGNAIKDAESAERWLDFGSKFCGGTIAGIQSKLPYLQQMGVSALWIGPIWKQVKALETYHGYGVQNFLEVEPRFGTREELRDLVRAAHHAGMYVVLDIILNHTGDVFEYVEGWPSYDSGRIYQVQGFCDASHKATLPFPTTTEVSDIEGAVWPVELQQPGIFSCQGQIHGWDADPEYLDGDFYDLKDLSLGQSSLVRFQATSALKVLTAAYQYWIAYLDIDGFRLDTVKHMGIGPTRWFTEQVHEYAIRLGKERFLILGEIAGERMFETVEATGLDAALGIGNVMSALCQLPRGESDANAYFAQFRNEDDNYALPRTWLRSHILTMLDDHDQIWKGNHKARFCAYAPGPVMLPAALMLNLCTLGIPCVYYGSEQSFDGQGGPDGPWPTDQFIRETMFGSEFGAFRTRGVHFFDQTSIGYQTVEQVSQLRRKEIALRKGRQYLREISGNGIDFGFPTTFGGGDRMKSIVAWSRVFDGEEILCAINTDDQEAQTAWITVDSGMNPAGAMLEPLLSSSGNTMAGLTVVAKQSRSVVPLTLPAAGFALFK